MDKIYRDKDPSLKSLLAQYGLRDLGFYAGKLDNWWGAQSEAAYQKFLVSQNGLTVLASTFADPGDLRRYRKAIADGATENEALKVGDNGIGYYGQNTATEDVAYCALPPERIIDKWGGLRGGNSKLVTVTYNGKSCDCILADIMPPEAYIGPLNGAGIDLNPGAVKQLNVPVGGMVPVTWRWTG